MTSVTGVPIKAQALSHWNNDNGENIKSLYCLILPRWLIIALRAASNSLLYFNYMYRLLYFCQDHYSNDPQL